MPDPRRPVSRAPIGLYVAERVVDTAPWQMRPVGMLVAGTLATASGATALILALTSSAWPVALALVVVSAGTIGGTWWARRRQVLAPPAGQRAAVLARFLHAWSAYLCLVTTGPLVFVAIEPAGPPAPGSSGNPGNLVFLLAQSVLLSALAAQARSTRSVVDPTGQRPGSHLTRRQRREIATALRADRVLDAARDRDVRAVIHRLLDRELAGWAALAATLLLLSLIPSVLQSSPWLLAATTVAATVLAVIGWQVLSPSYARPNAARSGSTPIGPRRTWNVPPATSRADDQGPATTPIAATTQADRARSSSSLLPFKAGVGGRSARLATGRLIRMDVLDELCGQWRLIAGGAVDPVPTEVLTERPGLEVRDDGRTSDLGQLMRLRPGGNTGLGLVEVDVSDDTTVGGIWRASPSGVFLADTDTGSGHGNDYGEFFRPRPWLRDTAWARVEDGELTLRDLAGHQTARLRSTDTSRPGHATRLRPDRATSLPPNLVAVTRDQLLGVWEPLGTPPGASTGQRWQNLEFTDDGWWHALPMINVSRGRWRHEPDGTLFAFHGGGKTLMGNSVWHDLDPWLYPVARAGLDGDQLVLLDDTNHELQRLQPTIATH